MKDICAQASLAPMVGQIPARVWEYMQDHACNLQFNINPTDVINGYGIRMNVSIVLFEQEEYCNVCKRSNIYNPIDYPLGHYRHTYEERSYEPVFMWTPEFGGETLEAAFNEFLREKALGKLKRLRAR